MENALRVTPLTVLPDITSILLSYQKVGFEVVAESSPQCVGLRADKSYLMLATNQHMLKDFEPHIVAAMTGQTIPYIWVKSLEVAKKNFADAIFLQETHTHYGTIEAVCDHHGQLSILAEKKDCQDSSLV